MSMKHIEVSKKIELDKAASAADLRNCLVESLERSIEIESITDGESHFKIRGTTGSPASITRYARLDLDVSINYSEKDKVARVIMAGNVRAARSLVIFYSFAFFLLLLVGLLPGFYETSQEDSNALDALFFLVFGIFIVFDVNGKISVTKEYLETALDALNTTFG